MKVVSAKTIGKPYKGLQPSDRRKHNIKTGGKKNGK